MVPTGRPNGKEPGDGQSRRLHRRFQPVSRHQGQTRAEIPLARPSGGESTAVHYFTAAVRDDPPAQARQATYLKALRTGSAVEVVLGRFQEKHVRCNRCGHTRRTYEEKETDVNLAVALLAGAVNDVFDTALVLSADSDMCPAVRTLKRLRPAKRVIAVFPPQRRSDDLRRMVDASFTLGDAVIRNSLLPDEVVGPHGGTYRRPDHWH